MISSRLLTEILTTLLEPKVHPVITTYSLKYNLHNIAVGNSKRERINNIVLHFLNNKEKSEISDSIFELIKELIDQEVHYLQESQLYDTDIKTFEDTYPLIYKLLQQDGLAIIDNELKYHVPKSVNISSNNEEIFLLLDKYKFSTPLGHLRQAMNNHEHGKWASANSQLRTYVESLFHEIAERIFGVEHLKGMKDHLKKAELSKTTPPIFDTSLNEWDTANSTGFINGFWKRLHPEGPHPGLSDINDSTFRLHLVLLVTANIIKRFDEYMKKKTL
jgi:hypothetical protein